MGVFRKLGKIRYLFESEKFCSSIFSKGYELVGSVTKNQFMNAWFSSTESDAISTLENSNPRN